MIPMHQFSMRLNIDAEKGYSDKSKKPSYFPRQHQIKNRAAGHQ
jgi:hypothetical protein